MKALFLSVMLSSTLIPLTGLAQTAAFYINDGVVTSPPQIDATNFVNNGTFNIFTSAPFDTSNTRNFTNRNLMNGSPGFRFDTFLGGVGGNGSRQMAANFVNSGSISAGGISGFFTNNFFFFGGAKLLVSATNIINPGSLTIETDGLLRLTGKNVDLTRASIRGEGFDQSFFNVGIFDRYWGVGSTNFDLADNYFTLPNPRSPFHSVIELFGGFYFTNDFNSIFLNNASAFAFVNQSDPTNQAVTVVFLSNPNPRIATDVRFSGSGGFRVPVVEWRALATNALTGVPFTNTLYLTDVFGAQTNLMVLTNLFGTPRPTFRPFNYRFSRTFFGYNFLAPGNTAFSPALLAGDSSVVTNDYSAYSVELGITSTLVDSGIPGASVTNLPGRIEITADTQLNLSRTRIEGQNYISLKAPGHFIGSTNIVMAVPFSDIELATTNSNLGLTNLLAPIVPRFNGLISMWSGRWTNTMTIGTNVTQIRVHVLMVDSQLQPDAPSQIQNLSLQSTNVVIGDVLNVFRSVFIDAESLTIASNGVINFLSDIIWSTALPRLQSLTNEGSILTQNAVYFGGARREPHFDGNFDEPYQNFVNRGTIATAGNLIWANYFVNGGAISASVGPITLQSLTGIMTGGVFSALSGDITLKSDSLLISNHVVQAGRRLFLAVTNQLTDGGTNSGNAWQVGEGFELQLKPVTGDLLGTTLRSSARFNADVVSSWAGEDRGNSVTGYSNNAALGKLVLDGETESLFTFAASEASNALYVDFLELINNATNFNTALAINPNMKVYFANANLPAEKLATHPSGRLCWVTNYTGLYSSTNIVYPSGQTHTFNTALVQSCNLDSDGDGIVNCADPTPISTPDSLMLSIALANLPPLSALVSWEGLANSTNFLYAKSNMMEPNWRVLTNFIYGPVNGRITMADPANGPCFYRVRVDPRQP